MSHNHTDTTALEAAHRAAIECSYRSGSVVVTKHAGGVSPKADIKNAIKFLQALLQMEDGDAPNKLKVTPELRYVMRCLRCGVEEGMPHKYGCHLSPGWPNVPDERPVQTRRQQLISAGIPAHEFDGIKNHRLDEPADGTPNETLADAFLWSDSPQGSEHWEKWESLLD